MAGMNCIEAELSRRFLPRQFIMDKAYDGAVQFRDQDSLALACLT